MKVFPEEVEVVIERNPAVRRCRVTGLPHAVLGTVPVAEVVLQNGKSLTPRELIEWCRETLSIYKVPVRVTFVKDLKLTASGKVRRV
jgi:long-chain acyl-CoA synthetase